MKRFLQPGLHCLEHWYRVMKILVLIMTVGLLHAYADVRSQTVSLHVNNEPLREVLAAIERQTGYVAFTNKALLAKAGRVSLDIRQRPLAEALDAIFAGQPLAYELGDKTIVIKEARSMDGRGGRGGAMSRVSDNGSLLILALPEVRGKVVDSLGNPLSGASVRVLDAEGKRTSLQTQTDRNGEFVLRNVPEGAALEISYIGYVVQRVTASSNVGTISLRETPSALQEVVINKGYYTESKRLSTGSVAQVTAADIEKQPIANPLQALQGRMAGVYIGQSTGHPGSSFNIQIRGRNSLRPDGNFPLYVIDGVPYTSTTLVSRQSSPITNYGNPLSSINPGDIASIEVLKDADATAIYGSRGANGVILITTKSGNRERTQLNVDFYQGVARVSNMMELLNTEQYLEMRHEALANDGMEPGSYNTDYDLLSYDQQRYTDWQNKLIGGTSNLSNIHASLSGGNSNTNFSLAGGYYKEGTVLPGDSDYQKGSGRLSLFHQSTNRKFSASFTANYVVDKNKLPNSDPTASAITLPPNAPAVYNEQGELNWANSTWFNPFATFLSKYMVDNTNLIVNTQIGYKVFESLSLRANLGYNRLMTDENRTTPTTSYDPSWGVPSGSRSFVNSKMNTWLIEPQLIYDRSVFEGNLNIILGTTFQHSDTEFVGIGTSGYEDDDALENIAAASVVGVNQYNSTQYRYSAVFARIHYNWGDKYLLNLTGRRDGSSRFGPDRQFGNFGAVGAAWIFTNEDLFSNKRTKFLGKLRASYGITGNDQIGDYGYLDTYSYLPYFYLGERGLRPSRIANPDFSWEATKKFEVALELNFLNDRISSSFAYYNNRSSNQLVGYALPSITGFTSVQYNFPATVENQGWEFQASTMNVHTKTFTWSTSMNLTIPKNRLVAYPDIENSSYANNYVVGQSLFIRKKFHVLGVDPQTGILQFEDVDGNGVGTNYPADLQVTAPVTQRFFGGLQNTFKYRGWELDVFLQFVKQTGMGYNTIFYTPGSSGNQPTIVMQRWRNPGDITDIQQFTQAYDEAGMAYDNAFNYGDNGIVDASFIRLKNIAFSYSLPTVWNEKLKLRTSRVYVQGQNLLTFTNYIGLDPENSQGGEFLLPPLAIFSAGIQFSF